MAKRTVVPSARVLYGALDLWRERCLAHEGSLFTPGRAIWRREDFAELEERFVDRPDVSSKSFIEKLALQLNGASPDAVQLMAEQLYLHFIITVTISGAKKREILSEVLGWMPVPSEIPQELSMALDEGLVNPGTFYLTGRDRAISFLIRFGVGWSGLSATERGELLEDPWAFRDFVWAIEVGSAYSQRNALLHLAFPDTFEAITSDEHKRLILDRFKEHVEDSAANVDRQLWDVRQSLEAEHGKDYDYYSPAVLRLWRDPQGDWTGFVKWATEFYAMPDFDAQERDYKLEAAVRFAAAGEAIRENRDDWLPLLRKALSSQNLTAWQANDNFLKWAAKNPVAARDALLEIYGPTDVTTDALKAFLDRLPKNAVSGVGTRANIASLLLMGRDPTTFPAYKPDPYRMGHELTGVKGPGNQSNEAQRYAAAISFLEQFMEEARNAGLEMRDLLDAQSLLWCITKWPPLDSWPAEKKGAFLAFRGDVVPPTHVDPWTDGSDHPGSTPLSLAELEKQLYFESGSLTPIVRLLERRRQIVLQGPPGTGKTFVAWALANHLAGPDGSVTLVQFHPSYSYEDFVEGFRPQRDGSFALKPGPLRKIAKLAEERPEGIHILLIDEINRANLAKVMGELYFLLEYRNEAVSLQYSDGEEFSLPRNLWIIGTMNTADRSIAIVDGALRRRFHFIDFYPDLPPVEGVLRRWLEGNNPSLLWVDALVDRANKLLGDREVAIGPSHFMKADYDDEWIRLVWDHSVLPYLREQLYGQEDRMPEFQLSELRKVIVMQHEEPTAEAAAPPESSDTVE